MTPASFAGTAIIEEAVSTKDSEPWTETDQNPHTQKDAEPRLQTDAKTQRQRDTEQRTQKDVQSRKINQLTAYYEVLPKNESNFMKPIRNWELRMGFVTPLIYYNIFFIGLFHVLAFGWSGYNLLRLKFPMLSTIAFGFVMGSIAGFGVTAGAHRMWSHRSFKARLPLQVFLLIAYTMAGQNTIFEWVRDHRVHHKFSETSADPHDANRGFFFSHVGWLMMKKHPDVLREGRKIDMSDIQQDPLIQFHTRHFTVLKTLLCFALPTLLPVYVFGESWEDAIVSQFFLRYVLTLNFTWSVNSFAHLYGNKPYDRSIMPAENWAVSIVAMGEGWHNYHHTFPWDYKAAELPYSINLTTIFLDLFAKIGWAYDMKKASSNLIKAVADKRGDKLKKSF